MGVVTGNEHENKTDSPQPLEISLTMSEREQLAQQVAGDNYGLSLEDKLTRSMIRGRLLPSERRAFNAGWEAAKTYYVPEARK